MGDVDGIAEGKVVGTRDLLGVSDGATLGNVVGISDGTFVGLDVFGVGLDV